MRKSDTIIAAAGLICAIVLTVNAKDEKNEPAKEVRAGEMIVTAGMPERDIVAVPTTEPIGLDIATSVVGNDDIQRIQPVTLTDALELAPGSWTETRGRKVKQFTSFRGQAYPYPDYAIDGLWFREFHEMPYFFPADELERIEVIRSSAALLMGNSGLAGVINLVPRAYDQRRTYAELTVGEDETLRAYLSHNEPMGKGAVYAGIGHYETDNHKDYGKELMDTASVRIRQQISDELSLNAQVYALDGERELIQGEPPAGKRFQTTREKFDPYRAVIGAMRLRYMANEDSSTELSLWGADRKSEYHSDGADGHVSHDDDDYEYGAQILQSMALNDNNTLRFGGLYHRWVAPDGKRFYAGNRNDVRTISAVVVDEHRFDKLTVDAGVRVSREHIDEYGAFSIEGSGGAFKGVEPVIDEWTDPLLRANLGCRYLVTDTAALYGNYAYGEADPRDGSLTQDNATPENELRHTFDAGVRLPAPCMERLQIGVFYALRNDAILLSGDTYETDDGLLLEFYENRDLQQYGIEIDMRSRPVMDRLALFANVTLMNTRTDDENGNDVDFREVPDEVINAGAYLDAGRADVNLFAKYVGKYENDRFAADKMPHPLGDYIDVNLTAGIKMDRKGNTRLYAKVENLFDDEYSTVVGYPDPGRRFGAGIQHSF